MTNTRPIELFLKRVALGSGSNEFTPELVYFGITSLESRLVGT